MQLCYDHVHGVQKARSNSTSIFKAHRLMTRQYRPESHEFIRFAFVQSQHLSVRELQVPEERLNETFLLRQLLRKDARTLSLTAERPLAESLVVREENKFDTRVATVVDEVHKVDVDCVESLETY